MEKTSTRKWSNLFNFAVDSKQPFHLVTYEDLLRDPVTELQKVMKFLEVANGFEQNDLQERLLCLSQNLQGSHKRKKNDDFIDPYTNELRTKLNSVIEAAEKKLAEAGVNVDFSSYKRELD